MIYSISVDLKLTLDPDGQKKIKILELDDLARSGTKGYSYITRGQIDMKDDIVIPFFQSFGCPFLSNDGNPAELYRFAQEHTSPQAGKTYQTPKDYSAIILTPLSGQHTVYWQERFPDILLVNGKNAFQFIMDNKAAFFTLSQEVLDDYLPTQAVFEKKYHQDLADDIRNAVGQRAQYIIKASSLVQGNAIVLVDDQELDEKLKFLFGPKDYADSVRERNKTADLKNKNLDELLDLEDRSYFEYDMGAFFLVQSLERSLPVVIKYHEVMTLDEIEDFVINFLEMSPMAAPVSEEDYDIIKQQLSSGMTALMTKIVDLSAQDMIFTIKDTLRNDYASNLSKCATIARFWKLA